MIGENNVPVYWTSETATPQLLNFTDYNPTTIQGDLVGCFGINVSGLIVGSGFNVNNKLVPIYWSSVTATPQPLNTAGYTNVTPFGVNASGLIVGVGNSETGPVPLYWSSVTATPQPLSSNGYVIAQANGLNDAGLIVGVGINVNETSVPIYWSSVTATPQILNNSNGGTARAVNDSIIADICFPAGTPVKTDQGIVNIEQLVPNKHTIRSQPILHITQTTTLDKYLISFEKNALNRNCPSHKTIMSKDHMLEFEGRMFPAYRFLDYYDQVKKVKYNGEILYNVLLPTYGKMEVNNLMCETLHPENQVARLYLGNTFKKIVAKSHVNHT